MLFAGNSPISGGSAYTLPTKNARYHYFVNAEFYAGSGIKVVIATEPTLPNPIRMVL